ncbi:sialoadhesin-like [Acipenser ruthenus]|uniref:sialoadhesin-like n=1 Tax=Acipenser ruthenus TaxID=7906 RepID=UPI0027406FAC|nr:sialoadhesin-like [Acipenser ruthenus]
MKDSSLFHMILQCNDMGSSSLGHSEPLSAGKPKPALTREPAEEISEGDTVTLSCVVEGGSGGWRYLWYKDRQGAPVYQTDSSRGTGGGYTISAAALPHSGEYWCRAGRGRNTSYSQYSEGVKIQVSELFSTPTLTVLLGASVWEGEAVTLQCGAHINKQGTQLQYRYSKDNGTVRGAGSQDQHSIPAAGLRDTGRYQCEVEAAGTGLKKRSASVSLTVRALFSRVTLTASPGATMKEGEALNLTCEAAVNKTPRPELHYTIVRDGEPVTNSTDSALYSIASTEKSHTGSYTCAVESQGVEKSSQELHIELQTSWHSAAAAAGFSVGFFVILLIVFTLLLLYHKIRGEAPVFYYMFHLSCHSSYSGFFLHPLVKNNYHHILKRLFLKIMHFKNKHFLIVYAQLIIP